MRVERIHVEAFRSLYDVTVEPRALSVLVGANNAGKTNVVDAIQFLAEVTRHGLEAAVGRNGGYENIAYRRQRRTKRPVGFSVRARLDEERFRMELKVQNGPLSSNTHSK